MEVSDIFLTRDHQRGNIPRFIQDACFIEAHICNGLLILLNSLFFSESLNLTLIAPSNGIETYFAYIQVAKKEHHVFHLIPHLRMKNK